MAEQAGSSPLFAVFFLSVFSLFLIPYTIYKLCVAASPDDVVKPWEAVRLVPFAPSFPHLSYFVGVLLCFCFTCKQQSVSTTSVATTLAVQCCCACWAISACNHLARMIQLIMGHAAHGSHVQCAAPPRNASGVMGAGGLCWCRRR